MTSLLTSRSLCTAATEAVPLMCIHRQCNDLESNLDDAVPAKQQQLCKTVYVTLTIEAESLPTARAISPALRPTLSTASIS